jgi:hypothetical protein
VSPRGIAAAASVLVLSCAWLGDGDSDLLPPAEPLEAYLASVPHLSQKQRDRMSKRQPFKGMTLQEAELSMHELSREALLAGESWRGVFLGGRGVRYYLSFAGSPPRVSDWSTFEGDEIELTDPRDLRPF